MDNFVDNSFTERANPQFSWGSLKLMNKLTLSLCIIYQTVMRYFSAWHEVIFSSHCILSKLWMIQSQEKLSALTSGHIFQGKEKPFPAKAIKSLWEIIVRSLSLWIISSTTSASWNEWGNVRQWRIKTAVLLKMTVPLRYAQCRLSVQTVPACFARELEKLQGKEVLRTCICYSWMLWGISYD